MELKNRRYRLFGQLLLEKSLIDQDQLEGALARQKKSGKLLGDILVDSGFIGRGELLGLLSEQANIEKVSGLDEMEIDKNILAKVPISLAKACKIFPVKEKDGILTIAVANPFDMRLVSDLHFKLGQAVRIVMAEEKEIESAINRFYIRKDKDTIGGLVEAIEKQMSLAQLNTGEGSFVDLEILKDMASKQPVVKLVNLILLKAVNERASDLHFEPFDDVYKIRYRVNGTLKDLVHPPQSIHLAISSRIKVLANLDIAERRLPQDGRILMVVDEKKIDIRVSTLPTMFGESVVLRILDKGMVNLSLDQVGLAREDKAKLMDIIKKPNGIILTTGPTGSGKTTALYSCINEINNIDSKIITVEDPVEYNVFGIIQVPIKPKINLDFARVLRHILRQDPDIILVGEIRDAETAKIAIQASLTGHLVLSTLHTNDAAGAITRLVNMGIEPFLIVSTLRLVMAQRLVRVLCDSCKERYVPAANELAMLEMTEKDCEGKVFYRAKGCSLCEGSGYSSRTGIFEVLSMTKEITPLIMKKASTDAIRKSAMAAGMVTLRQCGINKIFQGVTSIDEVAKQTLDYK
jgi:type IV pilus assembly protein PilB